MKRSHLHHAGRIGLFLLTASSVLATMGCTRSLQVGSAATDRTVPVNTAFILPPPGGPALVAVTERTYANGVQQDIALATNSTLPVQNAFRVRLFGPIKAAAEGQTSLPEQFQPLRQVDSEIRRAVPGVALKRAPFFVQNRYGPFGYAVGRRGSETCLYGFQNIRARSFSWNDRGSIDIRLRMCDTNATEAQLLAVMYGFTANVFVDAAGWNPYGDPAAAPEGWGAPGPDIYPTSMGQIEAVLPPSPPAPAPAPAPATQTRRAAAPARAEAAPLPQPIGPVVPPPPISARAVPSASTVVEDGSVTVPVPPVSR